MEESYRALFVRAQPRHLLAGLGVAWLSFGMVALAIFLTTHRATGSFGLAGVAVAAFSVGSGALAPLRGRLVDRRGTRPWLFVFASGYSLALLAMALLSEMSARPWLLVACAATSGASAPPLVASLRAAWPLVVEETLLRRAYALTSIVGDGGAVVAPVLGSSLFVAVSWLPLAVCAAAALVAALVVGRVGRRPSESSRELPTAAHLLSRSFVVLIAVEVALGVALGLVEVTVPAAATRWGATAYAGPLLGAFALGSILGGIWFGRRRWKAAAARRYLIAAQLLALALLPPIAATDAAGLAPLLLVAGLGYGPATISLFEALDDLTTARATEALTWITTAGAIGATAGSAAAGWAVSGIGLRAPFVAASIVLGAAATLGLRLGASEAPR